MTIKAAMRPNVFFTGMLIWAFVLGCGYPQVADFRSNYCALRTDKPVTIDGNLEEWGKDGWVAVRSSDNILLYKDSRFYELDQFETKWNGPEDLAFQWKIMWSEKELYLAVEVFDDAVMLEEDRVSYDSDCVEIFVDPDHKGEEFGPEHPESDNAEIHFVYGKSPYALVYEKGWKGLDENIRNSFRDRYDGQFAFKKTERGYILEAKMSLPGKKTFCEGDVIGMEIAVSDDDDGGKRDTMTHWTGAKRIKFWRNAAAFGAVRLAENREGRHLMKSGASE